MRRARVATLAVVGAVALLVPSVPVGAQLGGAGPASTASSSTCPGQDGTTTTWQKPHGHGGEWADGDNWSDGVPGPDDVAIVPTGEPDAWELDITVCELQVTGDGMVYSPDGSITARSIQLAGTETLVGIASLWGDITATESFTFTAGITYGPVTIPAGASMTIGGAGAREAWDITVDGELSLGSGGTTTLWGDTNGVVLNGELVVTGDAVLSGAAPFVVNGTVTVGPHELVLEGTQLDLYGRIDLGGGVLELQGLDGHASGYHQIQEGAELAGFGRLRMVGDTLTGYGEVVVAPDVVIELADGLLWDNLEPTGGQFWLTGGTIVHQVVIPAAGTAVIKGPNEKWVYGTLTNHGTLRLQGGGPLEVWNYGIVNHGTLVAEADVAIGGGGGLVNHGTWDLGSTTMALDGPSLDLTADGTLAVTVADEPEPVSGHLTSTEPVSLDGTLAPTVSGAAPADGTLLPLVAGSSRTGEFANLTPTGAPMTVIYSDTGAELRIGPMPPGPPTGAQAVPGNGQATVSWTTPTPGSAPITGYTVTVLPDEATQECSETATSCTITGLTNGTTYTFTVRATNEVGDGPDSEPSNEVTPRTVPGAPQSVKAVPGDRSATVSWKAPATTGGAPITGYTVTASPGTAKCSTGGPGRSCTISGLANGTGYKFRVTARNAAGPGAPSAWTSAVTPRTVPAAPRAVNATARNGAARVTWKAPAATGGAPITGYQVLSSPGKKTCTAGGTASACVVNGLQNGKSYTFKVRAKNAAGWGPWSAPSPNVVPRRSAPS
jgi:hypothetical protein